MPLIRPGKHKRSCSATRKRGSELPIQRGCLLVPSVAQTVQSDLGHNQRFLARKILKPCQVAVELLLRFEVYVETGKVEKIEFQVLRGGKIHVGDQSFAIFRFCSLIEPAEEPLNSLATVPAHYGGRDFVANRNPEQRGVARQRAHTLAYAPLDAPRSVAIVQKDYMLLPREPAQNQQSV